MADFDPTWDDLDRLVREQGFIDLDQRTVDLAQDIGTWTNSQFDHLHATIESRFIVICANTPGLTYRPLSESDS